MYLGRKVYEDIFSVVTKKKFKGTIWTEKMEWIN